MDLSDKIFKTPIPSVGEIEAKYPPRGLPDGAKVTRFAPSPTGFMHIGNIYPALICERVAHQSGGVFFLRIEDTDTKRRKEGATELIVSSLARYGIIPDEGMRTDGSERGAYGPYTQSERQAIYQAYIKRMLDDGTAYVCFATPMELEDIRKKQEAEGARPGYYGKWAVWRDRQIGDVEKKLYEGAPFVIRYKSPGPEGRKIKIRDLVKGEIESDENDSDIVIMKSDGLPTYHFAHIVDDHLMGTTHVIRGDEWLPSLPLHMQLFHATGWKAPKYAHIASIQKMDGGSRRKLSKRKDPEANISYYDEQGYPPDAVVEYLLNLANSNFEEWRRQNPNADVRDFKLELSKLSKSGALLDFAKLDSVGREVIAHMDSKAALAALLDWTKKRDPEFYGLLSADLSYSKKILAIEREGVKNIRKDIAKWSDARSEIGCFFDDIFVPSAEPLPEGGERLAHEFFAAYDERDGNDAWFAKISDMAVRNGYARNAKEFKAAPEKFKGDISDFMRIFRLLLTGSPTSPDLYAVMRAMGCDMVERRLAAAGIRPSGT